MRFNRWLSPGTRDARHSNDQLFPCRDDRFVVAVGDYRKPQLILWSTQDFTSLLTWQDEASSAYINCFTWNPMRANEFTLGCSNSLIRFCTIIEQTSSTNLRLQVVNGLVPSSITEHAKKTCEITACAYLISNTSVVLCATNSGFVTCWSTRTNACLLHWKADSNEICYMAAIKHRLITGSASGCLRLWSTESLEANLESTNANES